MTSGFAGYAGRPLSVAQEWVRQNPGNDGREDFVLRWMLIPALFIAGVAAAYKMRPPAKPGV
jgi:hypothetical protein